MIGKIIVIQEEKIPRQPVFMLNRGSVDLRNASVEESKSGADDQRPLLPDGVGDAHARPDVAGVEGHPACVRPQRIRLQAFSRESLQVIARTQAQGEVVGDADGVLQKASVLVGVRIGGRGTETLQIIMRDFMRVGAQPREFEAGFLGLEGERIYLDGIEDVLSSARRREEVIDPGEQHVAAELPGISLAFHAEGLGQMQAVLPGLPGKNGGASEALDNVRDLVSGSLLLAIEDCKSRENWA
jgi:hypothetical protein